MEKNDEDISVKWFSLNFCINLIQNLENVGYELVFLID